MTHVVCQPSEGIDHLIRRFSRAVQAAGVLSEARRRRFFIPTHEERRERLRRAKRRQRRNQRRRE